VCHNQSDYKIGVIYFFRGPYVPPQRSPRLSLGLDAYVASPLALCARRVSSAASRLLGTTKLRFALHGWQRRKT
ncbi:hypothetical protein, partial [Thiolapillus sp.]|uniref:hypothetical protein n=1 Tax=Thiolapillus sp. TaxID=2017437 RepID=UPI003AF9A0DA